MTSSRDRILNRLRATRRPFPDAPPRPRSYLPVTGIDDLSPQGLLERFTFELDRLQGQVTAVTGENAAREIILELLRSHQTTHLLAWEFRHIPVTGLAEAIRAAGIRVTHPEVHDEFRAETIEAIRHCEVGLTGADAAAAGTGTLIVSTGPGKGRIPTVLAPVHIAVITLNQIVPRIEDWIARERTSDLKTMRTSANICFITSSSRTGDIEMEIIRGVHGPGTVQVVVIQ